METLELQVKSADEALDAAAKQLGVAPDSIRVTVLDEQPGLFGKKKVRVHVESAVATPPAPETDPEPAKPARRGKKAPEPEPSPVPQPAPTEDAAPVAKPARRGKKPADSAPAEAEAERDSDEAPSEDIVATDEDADQIVSLLEEVLEAGDFEATVTVNSIQGKYVNLTLDGKDTAHLVGKNGDVLNSLQYVLNLILVRKFGNGVRAVIDANQYRERREEQLRKLATSVAEQVIQRGEEAVFNALPAFERRIVHKTLQEFEGVTTYSEGEEPNRHIVIAPAR